jgi:hypothetical protein
VSPQKSTEVWRSLKRLPDLKVLYCLFWPHPANVTTNSARAQSLAAHAVGMHSLRHFTLMGKGLSKYTDFEILPLISQLANLQAFELPGFRSRRFEAEDFSCLAALSALSRLNMSMCNGAAGTDFILGVMKSIAMLPALQVENLECSRIHPEQVSIAELAMTPELFQHFTAVRELYLSDSIFERVYSVLGRVAGWRAAAFCRPSKL